MKNNLSNSDIQKILGKNIKQIRLLKGLTQENLASYLQKSINFISLLENGGTGVSIKTLVDLCIALDCDVNTLFENIVPFNHDDSSVSSAVKFLEGKDKDIVNNLIDYIVDSKN